MCGGRCQTRPGRIGDVDRRFTFTASGATASFHAVRPSTLGIIGLGAIGGSLARQAKQAGIPTVLGWSPDAAERAAARRDGAIDDAPAQPVDVARAADDSNVVKFKQFSGVGCNTSPDSCR